MIARSEDVMLENEVVVITDQPETIDLGILRPGDYCEYDNQFYIATVNITTKEMVNLKYGGIASRGGKWGKKLVNKRIIILAKELG